MRLIQPWLGVTLALALVVALDARSQDPQMSHRGQMVMGFDQTKTTHRFSLYEDGGAIEVRSTMHRHHQPRRDSRASAAHRGDVRGW